MNEVFFQCCFCDLHHAWEAIVPLSWEEIAGEHKLIVQDHPELHKSLAQRFRMKFLCRHCFEHLKEAAR